MKILEKINSIHSKTNFIKNNIVVILFLSIGFYLFLNEINQNQTSAEKEEQMPPIDTLIPEGHVLVPIKIQNSESLEKLISKKGIVDLFYTDNGKTTKVGSQIRIIQAPYNPELYAALVKDKESVHLMKYPGPFTVVIQNQTLKKSSSLENNSNKNSSLEIKYTEGESIENTF